MKKIVFIANNNMPSEGMSGGDRIFIELIKDWKNKLDVTLCGSKEAINLAQNNGVKSINIINTSPLSYQPQNQSIKKITKISYLIKHILIKTTRGLVSIQKNFNLLSSFNYVYSVSDFYPDFLPALFLKLRQPKIKWIAGYYLFAPTPLAKDSPYQGQARIKGLLYYLMQIPSYHLIRLLADFVFVTSEPDVKKFITTGRNKNRIIVIRGGVDISRSEKYLKTDKIIPILKYQRRHE